MGTHSIHPELLRRRVRVLVVGCGATGSAVAAGLPHLHQSLIAYGHPEGLHVTVMDGDLISPTNCVRQPFSRFESGHYKALVLVNRLNLFWNLGWEALAEHLTGKDRSTGLTWSSVAWTRAHPAPSSGTARAGRARWRTFLILGTPPTAASSSWVSP